MHEVVRNGFLDTHVPTIRAGYKQRRDAMRLALEQHLKGCRWSVPSGGMFFWVELPSHVDAMALLPLAVELGMAFVPGEAFYASSPAHNTLRLSFVTVEPARISQGVALLAQALAALLEQTP